MTRERTEADLIALKRAGVNAVPGDRPEWRGAAPGRLLRTFPSAALLHPPLRFFTLRCASSSRTAEGEGA